MASGWPSGMACTGPIEQSQLGVFGFSSIRPGCRAVSHNYRPEAQGT